ncbi:MAG: hypothetical protein KUL75_01120 [Sterolibacterium sp.]|nr:hypothetical protein [Sterolibacterium sp.]
MSTDPGMDEDFPPQQSALEAFPNVLGKIQDSWASRDCDLYLQRLFTDTRGGTRRGFPLKAGEELLFLVRFNKNVRALPLAEELKIPFEEAFRLVDKGDQEHMADAGGGWADPRSATETFAHARQQPVRRDFLNYKVVYESKKKKSGILPWVIVVVLLMLAYKLLLPALKGG